VRVIEETPAYWRVVFDYPPFNTLDATIFEGLQNLLVRMDGNQSLRVVVFESANPDFYLAHFDLTGKTGNITTAVGPSGFPILMDTFVRLTKSSVVSIARIRGCVRGGSSEFVLACDMRFASRENTRLGQPEVAVGVHPGGGGTERLPLLVGRGRALEIILGGSDFDGTPVEGSDPAREGVDETIQLGVWKRPVDVSVSFRRVAHRRRASLLRPLWRMVAQ
jgi:enoyl-CoA hydratase/carnithine racemase